MFTRVPVLSTDPLLLMCVASSLAVSREVDAILSFRITKERCIVHPLLVSRWICFLRLSKVRCNII
jgi:hypothetical protein